MFVECLCVLNACDPRLTTKQLVDIYYKKPYTVLKPFSGPGLGVFTVIGSAPRKNGRVVTREWSLPQSHLIWQICWADLAEESSIIFRNQPPAARWENPAAMESYIKLSPGRVLARELTPIVPIEGPASWTFNLQWCGRRREIWPPAKLV